MFRNNSNTVLNILNILNIHW